MEEHTFVLGSISNTLQPSQHCGSAFQNPQNLYPPLPQYYGSNFTSFLNLISHTLKITQFHSKIKTVYTEGIFVLT